MSHHTIQYTHNKLKDKLFKYIETEYLGRNDSLRNEVKTELEKKEVLWQEPFIEANPSYLTQKDGLTDNSEIPENIRLILEDLITHKLGVYDTPYRHQVKSVETFYKNKDLLVATGTGSGKTECFMWPMITKLINEAQTSEKSWEQRGIRAIMLYPMNALVSDQIGRLRNMIGDREGKFRTLFSNMTNGSRIPQFGMYTGRTPYPGEKKSEKDKKLAQTLRNDLLNKAPNIQEKLINMGKYPAKVDLENFVYNLENGNHITEEHDAEMVTRIEMQLNTPDILITNYSMLEYMLMRTEEINFWENTKSWLNEDDNNKLLFIIDEAHMYKGAPGGEVGLLIRRLMHRLELSKDRIQFILTSASLPEQNAAVEKFACDLTGRDLEMGTFEIIKGDLKKFKGKGEKSSDAETLSQFSIEEFQGEDQQVVQAIQRFGQKMGLNTERCDFLSKESTQNWLYNELTDLEPLIQIITRIQGNAMKFSELARDVFPNTSIEKAEKATNVLLSIAPLAKNKEGQVLFPTRLHMMFRGLHGLYACANPNCTEKASKTNLSFGKVYLNQHDNKCKCGGRIFEIVNHRRCGAIYFKAYRNSKSREIDFFWNKKSPLLQDDFEEIYLFIPEEKVIKGISKGTQSVWLNSITGKIENDDFFAKSQTSLRLLYHEDGTYGHGKSCPNCGIPGSLSDFSTKGNQSFYNLISEQLRLQTQTIFDEDQLNYNPNGGRKVLLFSDSRQRAATLAKELTSAADEEALRKAVVKAVAMVQSNKIAFQSMDYLYTKFLEVAADSDLQFFYGDEEIRLKNEITRYKYEIEKFNTASNTINIRRSTIRSSNSREEKFKQEFDQESPMFSKYLLSFLSNQFRSLTDLGLCWIEPFDEGEFYSEIDRYTSENNKETILSGEVSKHLYAAWANQKIVNNLAFNHATPNLVNESLERRYSRETGIREDSILNKNFKNILKYLKLTKEEIELLEKTFLNTLATKTDRNDTNRFIRPDRVTMKYNPDHDWYKCRTCSKIFPYSIENICLQCFNLDSTDLMSDREYEGIAFLREPIIETIKRNDRTAMRRINTEEHTAQLSHKDQMDNMWSTTEEYELLFQDVPIENKAPVDILSCTTTMEVGIDIGSLTAVGLRNIPPMRENYQQRAGRAGRRSSAISTIITFINNGPHDNYYFYNPEKIISGEPRTPDVDVNNIKLITRHLNVIMTSDYLRQNNTDVNKISLDIFFEKYYNGFKKYLQTLNLSELDKSILIPQKITVDFEDVKDNILNKLTFLKKDLIEREINYINETGKIKSLLDVMLEEAIFPNYSFSRNVIGFTVENSKGDKVEQKPDRAIDVAISEYAPGRKIVIDKKTYISGGIYTHYSKSRTNHWKNPASDYFENASHLKTLYVCSNKYCNWNSSTPEIGEKCPFCNTGTVNEQTLLIPWGFAPKNGTNENELKADENYSYANTPSYSASIRSEDMKVNPTIKNLRYGRLIDQKLNIINTGPKEKGFNVCRLCGSAAPVEENNELDNNQGRPYKGVRSRCNHSYEEVMIGAEFKTDMILLEISLDNKKINTQFSGLWLRSATQTLTESLRLAATNLLDTDFNDINGGYRMRVSADKTFVDIYLFDSLSSGAGYCSMLENKVHELLEATFTVLNCPSKCDSSCHDCLNHFGNQRIQEFLDRNLGKELLEWCLSGNLSRDLTLEEQVELIKPLKELSDSSNKFKIDKNKLYFKNKTFNIVVQPEMWNKRTSNNKDTLVLSDKLLVEALPIAYDQVKQFLK